MIRSLLAPIIFSVLLSCGLIFSTSSPQADPVHPRCVEALDMEGKSGVDYYECGQLSTGLSTYFGSDVDGIRSGLTYSRPYDGSTTGSGYYGYQYVGDLAGQLTLLRTYENPGGNAVTDALLLVRGIQDGWFREDHYIKTVAKVPFGTRCASGIHNVSVISATRYRYSVRATPFDFVLPNQRTQYLQKKFDNILDSSATIRDRSTKNALAGTSVGKETIYQSLSLCANCCLANMVFEVDLEHPIDGYGQLIEAQIGLPINYGTTTLDAQSCLTELLNGKANEKLSKYELRLPASEYHDLISQFLTHCVQDA